MYNRLISLDLPKKQSAFIWGARKTGKSTFLKTNYPKSAYFDLLNSDLYLSYSKRPASFREEVLALPNELREFPIIVDEVQKIPLLLNEIHYLIEKKSLSFILCGSSARKLKRGHANLLGGRAWRFELFPLTYKEIVEKEAFDLFKALQRGLIPSHYLEARWKRSLKAYVTDYLKEEVHAEGLVQNLPSFSRFFDALGFCNTEPLNYTNIARDCGVDSKTVKKYFEILEDTHLGNRLAPYTKQVNRAIITSTPKFYLFDVGVAHYLSRNEIKDLRGSEAGKLFEHFIFTELKAYRAYKEKTYSLNYWRTKTGLEVDFILNGDVTIEVKISENISKGDLKGLLAFSEEHKPKKSIIVSLCKNKRLIETEFGDIIVYPFETFLRDLWEDRII